MIVVQNATTRWVGLGWVVFGLVAYVVYRRRVVGATAAQTLRAPPAFGPALALEYRRLLVPVVPGRASDEAVDVACRLAAERGARVTALSIVEVPRELSLDEPLAEEERLADLAARRRGRGR